uniref:Uncharacterized protein n=1 Tax=Setaria viridis TaxID=4556 RepID=A0A4U6VY61_SETVI|nr:LOW QUALITY PROTEIN: hypothetical protein SEVIR_2G340400v2 [Setaria viridis]
MAAARGGAWQQAGSGARPRRRWSIDDVASYPFHGSHGCRRRRPYAAGCLFVAHQPTGGDHHRHDGQVAHGQQPVRRWTTAIIAARRSRRVLSCRLPGPRPAPRSFRSRVFYPSYAMRAPSVWSKFSTLTRRQVHLLQPTSGPWMQSEMTARRKAVACGRPEQNRASGSPGRMVAAGLAMLRMRNGG